MSLQVITPWWWKNTTAMSKFFSYIPMSFFQLSYRMRKFDIRPVWKIGVYNGIRNPMSISNKFDKFVPPDTLLLLHSAGKAKIALITELARGWGRGGGGFQSSTVYEAPLGLGNVLTYKYSSASDKLGEESQYQIHCSSLNRNRKPVAAVQFINRLC